MLNKKDKRKLACADIPIRIRRGIIRIKIERTSVITVIPLTTEIEYVRSIKIAIICLLYFFIAGFIPSIKQ